MQQTCYKTGKDKHRDVEIPIVKIRTQIEDNEERHVRRQDQSHGVCRIFWKLFSQDLHHLLNGYDEECQKADSSKKTQTIPILQQGDVCALRLVDSGK